MSDAQYIKTRLIEWLLAGNLSFDPARDAIGSEVLFSAKKRSADLLILSEEFHALEIKSGYDDPRKLADQLHDYHKTFDKVSVVTDRRHLRTISTIVKPHTGLILFDAGEFDVKRQARLRKRLDKHSLLMFLRKNDLTKLANVTNSNCRSTGEVRRLLLHKLPLKEIRKAAYASLRNRYAGLFRFFLEDIGNNVLIDDLIGLSGRIDELY